MKTTPKATIRFFAFAVCILFSLVWFFVDGIQVVADTPGYVNFALSREPVYPTLLLVFRRLFGENHYFLWVGFFQCIFSGFAMWFFCDMLYTKFGLKKSQYFFCLLICIGVCLLTRFGARRSAMYSLDIASEGVSIPLFFLFISFIFLYVIDGYRIRYLSMTVILGLLLICTRKQMYITIPIMLYAFVVLFILKKINLKKLLFLFGVTILTFGLSVVMEMGYNKLVRDTAVRHSTDSSALLITTLYTADMKDAINIEEETIKSLFQEIIKKRDTEELGYRDMPGGWRELSNHYANKFDAIAFGVVNPMFYAYLEKAGVTDEIQREIAFGEINDYMLSCIMPSNIIKIAKVFVANALSGFCNTVAKDTGIFMPIILGVYIIYIASILFLGRCREAEKEFIIGLVTLGCIVVNVIAVSVMIFAQSRYMIYNMPIFYCVGYIMILKLFQIKRKEIKEKNG